jgi:hypothetical protein
MLGYHPLRATLLSPGTFERYQANRQAAGVELAHLKPPHVVTRDEVIDRLLQMSLSAA